MKTLDEFKTCCKCGSVKLRVEFSSDKSVLCGLKGRCKACQNAVAAARYAANPDKFKAAQIAKRKSNPERAKAIDAAWREANPEKGRASSMAWAKANPDKVKKNKTEWRRVNKEKVRMDGIAWRKEKASDEEWVRANKEEKKKNSAARYAANPDKIKSASAAWVKANPEKVRASAAAMRAKNPEKIRARGRAWAKSNPESGTRNAHKRRACKAAVGGALSKGLVEKLLELQGGMCPCCNQSLGEKYHLDHWMPLALGGSNTDDNMRLLHPRCNLQKGAKHPEDFMRSLDKLRNYVDNVMAFDK
jgi:5-methylcytosine-specific restriction endonuclease McrA